MNDAIGGISNAPPSTDNASIPLPPLVISASLVITNPLPSHYSKLFISSLSYQILLILVITSYLSSFHNLYELIFYEKVVFNSNWQQIMVEELFALHLTNTWDLVPLSPSKSSISSH